MSEVVKQNWTKIGTVAALICTLLGWGYTLGVSSQIQQSHTEQIGSLRRQVRELQARDHVLTELQTNMRWMVRQMQDDERSERWRDQ